MAAKTRHDTAKAAATGSRAPKRGERAAMRTSATTAIPPSAATATPAHIGWMIIAMPTAQITQPMFSSHVG